MAKLFTLWSATAAQWRKYGFAGHPSGTDARGYLDYIPHQLDPVALRDLAPRIPFELFEAHSTEFSGRSRGLIC